MNKLTRLLHGDTVFDDQVRRENVQALAASDFGPMLVAGHLWRELGLEATLDRLSRRSSRDATTLSDRALVLVANRLTAPDSEHGLARWLETGFVCDRDGRRFVAARRDDWERYSNTARVVEMRQLKQWYRTLDQLLARQSEIELARDKMSLPASVDVR